MSSMGLEYQVARMIGMAPSLIVIAVGAMLALRRMPMSPRPCRFLLAALAVDVFSMLGLPSIIQAMIRLTSLDQLAAGNQLMMPVIWGLPYSLANALVWSLVLIAVFDQPDRPKFLKENDPDRDILDR